MATTIRPEISSNNPYWIDRHRYYELKHFCLQYQYWNKLYLALDVIRSPRMDIAFSDGNHIIKTVEECAEKRLYLSERMDLVKRVAEETDKQLGSYIFKAVTTGMSYDYLKSKMDIPCGKEMYYNMYRKFFWILDKERK